ncbi:hypothetical protein GRI40_10995 [Altererythrobacter aerius]|uniref:Uncharacterized protein n=1 Tax=Tsuneonella aeria TaxID=1837929 RepID=A0A6I4TF75_9SPHN|nr:hypothetical protein [Tsuneonella aeria]MXO75743.1 hypothetical protein [Tsuneonella aeria]
MQLALLLLAVTPAAAPTEIGPLTVKSADGSQVVLGETLSTAQTYEAVFVQETYPVSLDLQVRRAIAPEPFQIIDADESNRSIRIKTTELGGFRLRQAAASVTPAVTALRRRCTRAMAYLDLDYSDQDIAEAPETFANDASCPGASYADPLRTLILEGLSKSGLRLWATTSPDPRWKHHEVIAANGQLTSTFAGQLTLPVLYASFAAPITAELDRIAWYEITSDGAVRKIGESAWRVPAP